MPRFILALGLVLAAVVVGTALTLRPTTKHEEVDLASNERPLPHVEAPIELERSAGETPTNKGERAPVHGGVRGGHDASAFRGMVHEYWNRARHCEESTSMALMWSIAILLDQQGRSSTPPPDGIAVPLASDGASGHAFIYGGRMYQFSSSEFPEFAEWVNYRLRVAGPVGLSADETYAMMRRIDKRVEDAFDVLCPPTSTTAR